MSNINQFGLAALGFKTYAIDAHTCGVSDGKTNITCQNVQYSPVQNFLGILLRWLIAATGIGAIVIWVFNSIYSNPKSDARSATQAVAKAFRAVNDEKKYARPTETREMPAAM
ncbi:MAG: hypothetical protein LBB26_00165 [Puniceicoccales bacterium]|jgi:hypothetical protein|nr:hypothetical protein [Puniceicoccales bacterium]